MTGIDDDLAAVTCSHYARLTSVPDIATGPVRLTTPIPVDGALTLEAYWRWRRATPETAAS